MVKIIEDPKSGKKTQVFDLSDSKDMELANKIAKEELEKMRGKNQQSEAEAEKELSKAEIGQEIFEDVVNKLRDAYTLQGLSIPRIESKEDLESATQNLHEIEKLKGNQKSRPEITGSAPLEGNIRASQGYREGYNSTEELITDLQRKVHAGDKEAEKVLGQLLMKSLVGVKEGKKGWGEIKTEEGSETELERLRRINREKKLATRGMLNEN